MLRFNQPEFVSLSFTAALGDDDILNAALIHIHISNCFGVKNIPAKNQLFLSPPRRQSENVLFRNQTEFVSLSLTPAVGDDDILRATDIPSYQTVFVSKIF